MSVQLANKYSENQPYHIYYNMDLINNNTSLNSQPVIFNYLETRNQPFLSSPENYFMSVVRFNVQTPTLPVFIPQIDLTSGLVNQTVYSVTLEWTAPAGGGGSGRTYAFQQPVIYVPYDLTVAPPPLPLTLKALTDQYYFIYSYTQWVSMINTAFTASFAGLLGYITAGTTTTGAIAPNAVDLANFNALTTHAPFMEFNPIDLTAIMNAQLEGYSSALANPVKIFFNSALFSLYNTFQFTFYGYTGVTLGRNALLNVNNLNNSNVYIVPAVPNWNALQVYQEGSTASLLNPITSIVFTTSLIPIVQENTGVPRLFSTAGISNSGGLANIAPIITDFVVPFSALNNYRPDITYIPSGEYRLTDLYGTSPLSSVEVSVYWKDTYGENHPFYLGNGSSASLKLMFRRKDFNASKLFSTI